MSDNTARDAYRKHEERGHTVATYEARLAVASRVLDEVIRERDAAYAAGFSAGLEAGAKVCEKIGRGHDADAYATDANAVYADLAERVRSFVGDRTGYWMCRNQTAALIEIVDDVVGRDARDRLSAIRERMLGDDIIAAAADTYEDFRPPEADETGATYKHRMMRAAIAAAVGVALCRPG